MGKETEHVDLNARKWDFRAETYGQKRFDYFRYMQKRLIALLPLKENICFLDIGCGTGWAVRYVADLLHDEGEFHGIDLSPNMIERARAQSQAYRNVSFDQANAERLPFLADHFDMITCTNSFHHYLHPARALNEIFRVLKPGGRIYILDVTADNFFGRTLDAIIKKREPEHVRFYSTQDYRLFFADAHLKHIASNTVLSPLKVHIGEKRIDEQTKA